MLEDKFGHVSVSFYKCLESIYNIFQELTAGTTTIDGLGWCFPFSKGVGDVCWGNPAFHWVVEFPGARGEVMSQ